MLVDIFIYINKQDNRDHREIYLITALFCNGVCNFFAKLDSGFQKIEKYSQNSCNSDILMAKDAKTLIYMNRIFCHFLISLEINQAAWKTQIGNI